MIILIIVLISYTRNIFLSKWSLCLPVHRRFVYLTRRRSSDKTFFAIEVTIGYSLDGERDETLLRGFTIEFAARSQSTTETLKDDLFHSAEFHLNLLNVIFPLQSATRQRRSTRTKFFCSISVVNVTLQCCLLNSHLQHIQFTIPKILEKFTSFK